MLIRPKWGGKDLIKYSEEYANAISKSDLIQLRNWSLCIPGLALEDVGVRALELAEATGAWSEGLPFRVKELIAHLHSDES